MDTNKLNEGKKRGNNEEIFIENKYVNKKLNLYTIIVNIYISSNRV